MYQDFTPRKEFLRQTSHPLNSFALLTFSSSSLIRLYSFPPPVVTTLRRVLQHRKSASAYREDALNGYCEFTLVGRPWSNAKSAKSERLVVNVLAVILQHGYSLLSSLDYGRETDDRLALTFSKPLAAVPRSSASLSNHSSTSPFHRTSPRSPGPISSHTSLYVIPFAVSFASSTIMRVISPPRDSTPAILQAVRGSWPRGVISEKKIGDSAYEFRLRGYRWFQEDTFAVDSLRHILNLLESLDSHAFTLLASLTLSGHSRVKDLWIFTGSSDEPQEDIKAIGDTALLDTPPTSPPMDPDAGNHFAHNKAATMPLPGVNPRVTSHARSASEGTRQSLSPGRPRELHFDSSFPWKKGSPRMRIPSPIRGSPELEHIEVASFISGANDMTGIGAGIAVLAQKPDVSYPIFSGMPISDANSPLTPSTDQTVHATGRSNAWPRVPALVTTNMSASPSNNPLVSPPPPILPPLRRAFSEDSYIADRPYSDGAQYLDLFPPHPFPPAISTPSSSKHATPPVDQPQTPSPPSSPSPPPIADFNYRMTTATGNTGHTVSALLGPNAFGVHSDGASDYATTTGFRDSAYTTGTSTNEWKNEIPIRWTTSSQLQRDSLKGYESTTTHLLPGGWKPTPVEEKEEDVATGFNDQDHDFPIPSYQRQRTPERHNTDAPRSPEIIEQEDMGRLGRVGVVGVYGEHEPEERKGRRLSKTTAPHGGHPLRISDSSVTRVPPNKLKRLSEGWVMVNVESSHKRPPVTEEAVPVPPAPSRREDANPRTRAQRMLRGRSHSDPQLRQTAEQHEHGQYARPRPSYSQRNLSSRESPPKSSRDRDRSGHKDKDRDEHRNGHHRPARISGSGSSQNVLKGTTSHAAKAIAMIDAAHARSKKDYRNNDDDKYATYPGVRQTPMSPGQRALKKLLGRGDTVEKSEKPSRKSKKHASTRSHKVV
ncbi:hypothetical protein BDM02DRAFT_3158103 [Thelephora ganbajun]|uniref:Uncharacterized protein n=1 Tax=Thelephora ganbajun TaxID=370292 RepID=A0ACB6ZXY9_THEGA|nr:hypothetical protein BDM02DRAFT_3158103 [Thelephora ganbajun]